MRRLCAKRPFAILCFFGVFFSILGICCIFGEFLFSTDSLYLYRDNIWSLYGDVSGSLPFSTLNNIDGGFNNLFLQLAPSGLIHLSFDSLLRLLGVNFTGILIEKIYFAVLIVLTVNIMLFVSYKFLSKYYSVSTVIAGSIFASFIYMFNPLAIMNINWALHFTGYAFLPLVLYLLDRIIESRQLSYAILLGLVIAFVGPLPHWLFVYGFVVAVYLLFNIRTFFRNWFKLLPLILVSICVFLGASSYFILPALQYSSVQGLLHPDYIVTQDFVDEFSANADMANNIRLLGKSGYQPGDWDIEAGEGSPSSSVYPFWLLATFSLPIFASLSLFGRRKKLVLFSFSIFLFSIFLSGGSNLLGSWYYSLANLPIGWIFRVPTKWLWFAGFSLSFLVGFSVSEVFSYLRNRQTRFVKIGVVFIAVGVLLAAPSWQLFTFNATGITEPVYPPLKEVDSINRYLEDEGNGSVLWLPFTRYHTWNNKVILDDFYTMSSRIRAIDPASIGRSIDSKGENFLRYNVYTCLLNNQTREAATYLKTIGVQYIVWHEDYTDYSIFDTPIEQLNAIFENMKKSEWFDIKVREGILTLFELKNTSKFGISTSSILLFNGLEKINSLEFFSLGGLNYLLSDQDIKIAEKYGNLCQIVENPSVEDLIISLADNKLVLTPFSNTGYENPSKYWSKGSVFDTSGADWHPYLTSRNISNWQFDYNKGVAFTWASLVLTDSDSVFCEPDNLVVEYSFEDYDTKNWGAGVEENRLLQISVTNNSGDAFLSAEFQPTSEEKALSSPMISVNSQSYYRLNLRLKGTNFDQGSLWIAEFNRFGEWIGSQKVFDVGSGDFDWKDITIDFTPSFSSTEFVRLDIAPAGDRAIKDVAITSGSPTIMVNKMEVYDIGCYAKPNQLDIPFTVDRTDNYYLFARCLRSKDGGAISLVVDDKIPNRIATADMIDEFFWTTVGPFNLSSGAHKLSIENKIGLNAVNLCVFIPVNETIKTLSRGENFLENKKVIYVFEAESDLYSNYVLNVLDSQASSNAMLELTKDSIVENTFEILKEGNYSITMHAKGNLTLAVDNLPLNLKSSKMESTNVGPFYLEKGVHNFSIKTSTLSFLDVMYIWSYETQDSTLQNLLVDEKTSRTILGYQQFDNTKYVVHVNASQPFMLSFAEKYDPLWIATVNGERIESLPLSSAINGFWINKTGTFEIIIEYDAQVWYYNGIILSVFTVTASIAYLSYLMGKKLLIKIKS